jgi:hypothetical protein
MTQCHGPTMASPHADLGFNILCSSLRRVPAFCSLSSSGSRTPFLRLPFSRGSFQITSCLPRPAPTLPKRSNTRAQNVVNPNRNRRMAAHTPVVRTAANPYKVFVAGGCYSGLSAAIHLLERCDSNAENPIHVAVTIVDERDGFCMSHYVPPVHFSIVPNTD